MARIRISYRSEDSGAHARRLEALLRERFGADEVFSEIDTADGARAIELVRSEPDVLIVVIGKNWLVDAQGRRPLDDLEDDVRWLIAEALEGEIRVLPVLVDAATMPRSEDLPESLSSLVLRRAFVLSEENWEFDSALLLQRLDRILEDRPTDEGAEIMDVDEDSLQLPTRVAIPVQPSFAEPQLSGMLREAALTGVVPALVPPTIVLSPSWDESPAPPPPAPMASAAPPAAEPVPVPEPSPPAPRGVERRAPGTQAGWLLWIVGPLVVIGAAAAAAKWLLGWMVDMEEAAEATTKKDTVQCTVFAPESASRGHSILVQVFAHMPEQADDARAIATELDTDAVRRAFRSLESPIGVGSKLEFELRMPGLEVRDSVASLVWRRRTEMVEFGVRIPPDTPEGAVIGTVLLNVDSAPVGHVKFKLSVASFGMRQPEPQGEQARRYTAAFISYASKDQPEVVRRVQVLSTVGIKYFQDVLSLEPGDRWSRKIELGIDECDLFLLFWSSEAKRSEWVRKEVQYALARKAGDDLAPPEIRPVILEGPPIVEPWAELADLHFNDPLLYFMRAP